MHSWTWAQVPWTCLLVLRLLQLVGFVASKATRISWNSAEFWVCRWTVHVVHVQNTGALPSGNDEHSYGKSQLFMGKLIINSHFPVRYNSHYQRVPVALPWFFMQRVKVPVPGPWPNSSFKRPDINICFLTHPSRYLCVYSVHLKPLKWHYNAL